MNKLKINQRFEGWTIFVYWLKCSVDKLNYSNGNQKTVSHSTFYHFIIILRYSLGNITQQFPETSLILYHKSPSNLRQCVWSILQNIANAQPGLKEDQPHHLAMHCCGNLRAHVSVDSLEFSCRYPSASRPITLSKIFIIHSHQSSASEMEDTALGILFYFFFTEIIFSAEILTVHFKDLIP